MGEGGQCGKGARTAGNSAGIALRDVDGEKSGDQLRPLAEATGTWQLEVCVEGVSMQGRIGRVQDEGGLITRMGRAANDAPRIWHQWHKVCGRD